MKKVLSYMLAFLMAVALVPSQALAEAVEESIVIVQQMGDEDPVDPATEESLGSVEQEDVLAEVQDDTTPKFHVQTAQIQGINGTTLTTGPNYKHVPTTYYWDIAKGDYPVPYRADGWELNYANYLQSCGIFYPGDKIVIIGRPDPNPSGHGDHGQPGITFSGKDGWIDFNTGDKFGPLRMTQTVARGNWHTHRYVTEITVEDAPVMFSSGSGNGGTSGWANSNPADPGGYAQDTWSGSTITYIELPKYHPVVYRYTCGSQEIPAADLANMEFYENQPANPEVIWAEDLSTNFVPYETPMNYDGWTKYQAGNVFTFSRPFIEGYFYEGMSIRQEVAEGHERSVDPWCLENSNDEQTYTSRFKFVGDLNYNWSFINGKWGSEEDPIVVTINYSRVSSQHSTITVDANGGTINGRSEWMFNSRYFVDSSYGGSWYDFDPQDHMPTRDGYEFDGWYADAACTQIVSPSAQNPKDLDGYNMYESDVKSYVYRYGRQQYQNNGANHIRIYAKWVSEGAKSITDASISVPTQTYSGSALTPSPTITDGDKTLIEGVDYRILYCENNVNATTNARVLIAGIGDYKGVQRQTFSINQKRVTFDYDLEYTKVEYDGEWHYPEVRNFTCSEPGLEYNDTNFYTGYSNARNASSETSKASVYVYAYGNYTSDRITKYFEITPHEFQPTIKLNYERVTYDGTAQMPGVTVFDGNTQIYSSSSNYTTTYKNNVDPGTATVTVALQGNYRGTASATFQIVAATKSFSVAVDEDDYTEDKRVYDEWYKEPNIIVKSGSTVLTQGTDYRVSYKNNYYPGTATVTVTGVNEYAGYTGSTTFQILKSDIGTGDYTGKVSARRYTGEAVEPKPSLYVQLAGMRWSTTLDEGEDYVVTSYSNNVEVGTATMTIKGTGYFTGTATLSFVIEEREGERTDISGARVTINEAYDYTGKPVRPYPTVEMPGMYYGYYSLRRGNDYDVSYQNNVEVGTAYLVITGADEYVGTVRVPFQIVDPNAQLVDVSAAEVTVAAATYTGKALTPAPTVKIGGKTLAKGTDYTVSYANNVKAGTNTATLTITGVTSAGYTGTKTVSFTIGKASISKADVSAVATQAYTGKAIAPAPKVTFGGKTLAKGTDYTLTYANNTKAGTATITVAGKGNFKGSRAVAFKIAKLSVALAQSSYTYTGKAVTPGVTVKMGSTTLKKNTHYTVTYASGRKAVGAYDVKVALKGGYAGAKTASFTIVPKGTDISKLTAVSKGLKATWGKQATQTTGYQVQCATDAKFTAGVKTVTVKGTATVSQKVTKLTGNKKYYVRVRTYKTVGGTDYYSSWSVAKTVTTKA